MGSEIMDEKKGLNRIKPSKSYISTDRREAVRIRMGEAGAAARDPITLPFLMKRTAYDHPDHKALGFKNSNGIWETITFKEYRERVLHTANVFIKLGLERHNSVGILAFNCPEWFISAMSAVHAGGICAGIYTTNSAEAVAHCLNVSCANIVIVDDSKQMDKIRQFREKLPMIKAVIQLHPPFAPNMERKDGYYRWSEIEDMVLEDETELYTRLNDINVNDCCNLVFTSGTVGQPKGVMLSHDNIIWSANSIGETILPDVKHAQEILISFLPLSHIAAQVVDVTLTLAYAATTYFADKDALKGTLINTLNEVKPTRFLAVPRVYEKMYEKMMSISGTNGMATKILAGWAKNVALNHWMTDNPLLESSLQYKFVRNYILSKIRSALGFDRCVTLASAAAPLSSDIKKYFMSIDLPIIEAFGMSETSGPHCVSSVEGLGQRLETIGKPLAGVETKIINKDESGQGEILMRGRHIFMGYINDPEKTTEAINEDGWIHSGDIGYIDDDGYAFLTGRLKEIIITAGGENIPPIHVEHLVKNELPVISNAVLIGDKRKFLTILLTIKTDMDMETGASKDDLHKETITWCRSLGLPYTKLSEILNSGPCPKVMQMIEEGIIRANKKAISNAQKIQKFAILPHDFSMFTGEIGPTLKIKRNVVADKYHDIIEKFYAETK